MGCLSHGLIGSQWQSLRSFEFDRIVLLTQETWIGSENWPMMATRKSHCPGLPKAALQLWLSGFEGSNPSRSGMNMAGPHGRSYPMSHGGPKQPCITSSEHHIRSNVRKTSWNRWKPDTAAQGASWTAVKKKSNSSTHSINNTRNLAFVCAFSFWRNWELPQFMDIIYNTLIHCVYIYMAVSLEQSGNSLGLGTSSNKAIIQNYWFDCAWSLCLVYSTLTGRWGNILYLGA